MGVETSRGSREVNAQRDLGREKQAIPSLSLTLTWHYVAFGVSQKCTKMSHYGIDAFEC